MATPTSLNDTAMDDSQDWEVISIPEEPHEHQNPYIHFQLNSWLGRFSLTISSTTTHLRDEPQVAAKNQQEMSLYEQQEMPIHEQQQSPLFNLPTEIRLHIYELLFRIPTENSGVQLRKTNEHHRPRSLLTSLLTCRRFRNEAEKIFYQINRIFIDDNQILTTLGDQRSTAITRIALLAQSAGSLLPQLQNLRSRATNVKSLHIVRPLSVKYIDPRSWAIMAPQIISEIEGMESLEEVKFITPDAKELNEGDVKRRDRLFEIDARICGAVRSVED